MTFVVEAQSRCNVSQYTQLSLNVLKKKKKKDLFFQFIKQVPCVVNIKQFVLCDFCVEIHSFQFSRHFFWLNCD